jgi:pyruvate dehydrogenase E2 component (dihydrolipoamide acetyltransferase)
MPTELKLPELGENIAAGDVVRVLVKPGDTIAKDQAVIELETDKATIEVPSSIAGVVKDVQVKPGQKIKVGQTILTVDGEGAADGKPAAAPADAKQEEAPKKVEAAESDEESDEPAEKEARPAQAAEKPEAPNRKGAPRLPEDEVEESPRKRGEVVDISRAPRSAPQPAAAASDNASSAALAPPAAPSVRRIARELGVEIRQVNGTGPGGRITVDDVQGFVRQALAGAGGGGPSTGLGAGSGSAPTAAQQPLPDFTKFGDVERKPLSNIRRKTAEHLGHAWNVIPHVTNHDKTDITALEELRKKYGPQAERAGGKLTVTVVALKILASAIRKFPQFAASIDLKGGQLIYKKYVNMGVAVDTDRGLLVPVIRDVDKKGIVELSAELAKLSEKARAGKLSLDEMSGGVMTITNLGGIGGVGFTPIVNWPEVAILGISRGSMEPVWNGQEFQPRLMLPLSLSYDHRVVDGADAARFLRFVADAFEQPFVLAL